MQKGQTGILILVGILVLVGIVGGAYFLGKSGKVEPVKVVSTPQINESTASADVETANWKTYINTELGYSFRYPQTWIDRSDDIDRQQKIVRLVYVVKGKEYAFFVGAKERGGPSADSIESITKQYGNTSFSIRTWVKDNNHFFIVARPENHSVAGGIEINLPSDNPEEYVKVFDQILSTFRFIP